MAGRPTDEEHRSSTPLELFFDLCFVVAVAQAAAHLHHDVAAEHASHGVVSYAMVFFAIWWAWMNFTWFASAYDTDDDLYRLTTLVQIAGALVLAAGVPRAFDSTNYSLITYGYVLMRLAMVAQWLRAAHDDPGRRSTAVRFAVGITVVQIGWLVRLILPPSWAAGAFLVLVVVEVLVPILAERQAPTRWHPEHIAERYSLFTLIVLGEVVLASTTAVQSSVDAGGHGAELLGMAIAALVIVFSMWWLYFDRPAAGLLTSLRRSLFWGYGHYLVFASIAAVGAGIAVAVDGVIGETRLSTPAVGYAVAVPVAIFLVSVWILHVRPDRQQMGGAFPVTALLVLAAPWTGAPVQVVAVLLALLGAVTRLADGGRRPGTSRRAALAADPD